MRRLLVPLLAAALGSGLPAAAQTVSEVDLLPGWSMQNGHRMAGVRIRLAPGWKTYWRAPMGNGIPPEFDWSGSANVARAVVHWPRPEVFESFGALTIGYQRDVVFPVEITPQRPGEAVELDLSLFYGVCSDVCIPAEADEELDIAPRAEGATPEIRAALETRALTPGEAGIAGHSCDIRPEGDAFALTARIDWPSGPVRPEMVVIESGSDEAWIDPREVRIDAGALWIEAGMEYYGDGPFAFDRGAVRMTFLGTGRPIELVGCPAG